MAAAKGLCFFDLPAEIRNEIYCLTLKGTTTSIVRDRSSDLAITHTTTPHGRRIKGLPGILSVSEKVSDEASPLFYSSTRFTTNSSHALVAWLQNLKPEWVSAIKSLTRWEGAPIYCRDTDLMERRVELMATSMVVDLNKARLGLDYDGVEYEVWFRKPGKAEEWERLWSTA